MTAIEEPPGTQKWVGQALRRKEDPRMITGRGRYVDDMVVPGMLYMAVVRSPEAHAKITSIDASAAKEIPGIHGVFTGADLDIASPLPMAWVPPGVEIKSPEHWPLAKDEVNYVGQGVAVVVGEDKYAVVDAAEQVFVEYDPLPVVVDPEKALEDGAPLVHPEFGTNQTHEWSIGGGDMDQAWADAEVVVERRIVNHRTAGTPIEPRVCIADYRGDQLTLHLTSQNPHLIRLFMAGELGMSEDRIRVIAPDVGGGFGVKISHFPEEVLAAWISRKVGRAVKWTETRSEHMSSTIHGRDQIDYVKVGAKRDGTIVGLECTAICDLGAYYTLLTPFIPCFTGFVISGCYKIPNLKFTARGVFTNKMATDATRGAGRPEATHLIEVMVEQLAYELGMDPLELRRKNFIPKEDFPAEVAIGIVYDSGDYDGSLDKLLTHVDMAAFRREQEELRAKGIYRGIGFSTWMEICGLAPSRAVGPTGVGLQAGFYESSTVRVHASGSATVYSGTAPHGQGLDTAFAQIVADQLGISPDMVDVVHGDTGTGPFGLGTYGSRSLAVGGESIARSTGKLVDKAKQIAAHNLEAAPEDIELVDGKFSVKGSPDKGLTLAEVAGAAYVTMDMPDGMEPGLEASTFYDPENFVFPFGAHACISEVDVETGKVDIVRYVSVDDCGPAINPNLIDGQIHGGITHGVGQALFERIHYDDDGQLVTGTFVDYALPSAADVPSYETDRTETPSPVNSLGVKGVGEAGTIAATPAIMNSVIDALRPVGVDFINMPLSPQNVWATIQEAQGRSVPQDPGKQGGSWDEHGSGSAGSGPTGPNEGGAL
ncbi:MAG TPA: xanthine dehydrogenase family protein molybdopterin-binding subunit [Solirubrobacteraceae bacterium]|nr:xanthine dehydrogenase family protein molybdopterin-binding subunit [Solirubrobacteraceae bacterium]